MYDDYLDDDNDEEEFMEFDDNQLRCANCGALIEDERDAIKVEKYGDIYYFCSEECKDDYDL